MSMKYIEFFIYDDKNMYTFCWKDKIHEEMRNMDCILGHLIINETVVLNSK